MSRFALQFSSFLVAVAILTAAAIRPAHASVSGATLTTPNPSISGVCPVTMTFSGTITGSPGTTFQYSFNREINGAQQIQNAGAATMPTSGSMTVNDSFVVSSSSSGVNFDQIWVHNISGNFGDVYSPRASFSVSCGASTPGPSGPTVPSHIGLSSGTTHSATQLLYGIPMPVNLKSTTDPHVCGQHGGLAGVFCIQAVPDRYLILVWDWQSNDKWPSIDGYHIYDVTGGGKTRVQDQTNPQATVEFFKPGSYANKCYAVSAYKGATESAVSAPFCTANAKVGVKTESVKLLAAQTRDHLYCAPGDLCGTPSCGGIVCMGWFHVTHPGHANYYRRGYLLFDQSQVVGRNIYSAKLQLITAGDPTCLGGLGTANEPWVGTPYSTLVPLTLDLSIPRLTANAETIFDVTALVRDWSNGGSNNGFVLVGTNENSGAEDDGNCFVDATKVALAVQYY